jgi:hypothetical protein
VLPRMESRSPGGYLASEPVLLVVRCDTRSLRFLQDATRAACVSLGVRSVSALPQTSASGTPRLQHSVGVWA